MQNRLLPILLLFDASVAQATDIQLYNGRTYRGVTVISRTLSNLEVQVPFGTMLLTLHEIDTIDGLPMHPKAVLPPVLSDADHPATALPATPPPYRHDYRMDVLLLALAFCFGVWIAMVVWVQRDARGKPAEIKRANADVLLLPGLGFLLYLVARARRSREKPEPRTLDSRVAGLKPDEVPKKRGLFVGRALFANLFGSSQKVELEFLDANRNPIQVRKDMPEMTGIEAASELLEGAIAERASDIHLEPYDAGCRVRFRVDGVLHERMSFERTDGLRVTAALKTLAQIDVAEKRKAQDGRFRVRTRTGEVDFRVASASSIHGEKLVLRILDRKSGLLGLSDLGMPQPMMELFDRVIHSRNGIILATGPTGSGKTSTLYAALSRLDAKRLNIMSIEDPVEYELDGATQIAVNVKAGISFEAGLRSILRQDPDVIFVGEIRDPETAKTALRAALTGHLVFSSLHTQDAPGSVVRLSEMGAERYQISSAVLMIVTQRLVRIVCHECRESYVAAGNELADIGLEVPAGRRLFRATGCEACDHTGYQGRTGIFELLVMDDTLRKAVNDGASQQDLGELASRKGYRRYREDGLEKILNGTTTVEEVLQAS